MPALEANLKTFPTKSSNLSLFPFHREVSATSGPQPWLAPIWLLGVYTV